MEMPLVAATLTILASLAIAAAPSMVSKGYVAVHNHLKMWASAAMGNLKNV